LDYSDESYSLQYNQPGEVAFIITNNNVKLTYVISNEGRTNKKIYSNGWKSELPADFAPIKNSDGGLMICSRISFESRFNGILDNWSQDGKVTTV